jgi:5-methylcytosine-specific restriction endonuclease McrA
MKKLTIGKLQKILWEHCKRIIRARYALKTPQNAPERWECYTCGIIITNKCDAQTGHFIAKSVCGASLKYDLRNLRIQCMSCNVWKGGNGAVYYRNMVEREGQEYVDQLFLDKQKSVKAYDKYLEQIAEYEKLVA